MNLSFETVDLHLRHTFTISRRSLRARRVIIVRLEHDGLVGHGEAAPMGLTGESIETVTDALPQMAAAIGEEPWPVESICERLAGAFPQHPAARAAVDMALRDLAAQRLGAPLYRVLGLDPTDCPMTSFTIGIDTPDVVRTKVEQVADWPILKLKLGCEHDLELIRALRELSSAMLRVDANAGWTPDQALERIRELEPFGVEFVEQPIPPGDLDALRRVHEASPLPIFADESCVDPEDVPRLAGCVDGINIKLMKCGGIGSALRMIHTARACGLKLMLGCNIESSIAITAAAHLAPLVDYLDLDGHILITDDPFVGMQVDRGRVILPEGPGLGVTPR
jgi:L-alanine-DL-glutamate epimerase-like enolase superfamily enzyme